MIDLIRLHHVSFSVSDLERAKQFFGEVLGLPELERPAFGFSGAWYALGDRQLHLIQEASGGRASSTAISRSDHMALEVKDIEAVKNVLGNHGVEYAEGRNRALGMEQVFCRDPDGHTIEFVRYYTR